jgi:hypothetical protein
MSRGTLNSSPVVGFTTRLSPLWRSYVSGPSYVTVRAADLDRGTSFAAAILAAVEARDGRTSLRAATADGSDGRRSCRARAADFDRRVVATSADAILRRRIASRPTSITEREGNTVRHSPAAAIYAGA